VRGTFEKSDELRALLLRRTANVAFCLVGSRPKAPCFAWFTPPAHSQAAYTVWCDTTDCSPVECGQWEGMEAEVSCRRTVETLVQVAALWDDETGAGGGARVCCSGWCNERKASTALQRSRAECAESNLWPPFHKFARTLIGLNTG
jgi:hypothetical protein